jgi:hypothetical protein
VATRKFFPTGQLARWAGSIVAFVGLRKGIKYYINSENPVVTAKAIELTRIASLQTEPNNSNMIKVKI